MLGRSNSTNQQNRLFFLIALTFVESGIPGSRGGEGKGQTVAGRSRHAFCVYQAGVSTTQDPWLHFFL